MKKKLATLMQPTIECFGDKGKASALALVDTGASYSFIRRSLAERISTIVQIAPMTFTLADGRSLSVDHTAVVTCEIDGMRITDNFMVQPDELSSDDLIIGAATIRKYGLKIDLGRNEVFALITDSELNNVEEVSMNEQLKMLMARLGLTIADGMTDDQAMEAIAAKATAPVPEKPTTQVASLAILALIECTATATESEVKGKIMALKNPGNVVPAQEMVALRAQLHERDISDTVNGALADGKLTPAEKAWALGQAKADLPAFKAFVAHRPQQIPLHVTLPREEPQAAAAKLDDTQALINKQLGISNATFAKYAQKLTAES